MREKKRKDEDKLIILEGLIMMLIVRLLFRKSVFLRIGKLILICLAVIGDLFLDIGETLLQDTRNLRQQASKATGYGDRWGVWVRSNSKQAQ